MKRDIVQHFKARQRQIAAEKRAAEAERRRLLREQGIAPARVTQARVMVGVKGLPKDVHPAIREFRKLGDMTARCTRSQEAWRRIGKEYGSLDKADRAMRLLFSKNRSEREFEECRSPRGRPAKSP